MDMAYSASSRLRECGTDSTDEAMRTMLISLSAFIRVHLRRLFFLLLIPQLARQHPSAERAIVQADELVALIAEDQEEFGIDVGDDGAVGELIGLRVAHQVAVHQPVEIGAAHGSDSYWMVLAPWM